MRWRAVLAALLLTCLTGGAGAGPVDDGYDAYSRGDFARAFELWSEAARQGDMVGMNNLGVLYLEGLGRPKDVATGLAWVRKSADQGYSGAEYNLALHYEDGDGVPRDQKAAVLLYAMAGSKGHAAALREVGLAFRDGRGVPVIPAEAYKWLELAARRGEASAAAERDEVAKTLSPEKLQRVQAILAARDKGKDECKRLGQTPIPAFSVPVGMQGFRFFTPMGGGWCDEVNAFRSTATFDEVAIRGTLRKDASGAERQHTIIAIAERMDVVDGPPRTADELLALAKRWAGLAFPTITQLSGKVRIRRSKSDSAEDQRFKAIGSDAYLAELNGLTCARFNAGVEETGNKLFPKTVLQMNTVGYLCLDPNSTTDILGISVSERFGRGQMQVPEVLDPNNLEYEVFLRSLAVPVTPAK